MPILKQYVDSSNKQGLYILAKVGDGSPVTLQVSELAKRLLHILDFEASDTVPSKLVWSMYDVGLLYTLASIKGEESNESTENSDSILDTLDMDSSLSEEREEGIIKELEDYDGPDAEEVDRLIQRLQNAGDATRILTERHEGAGLLEKWADDAERLLALMQRVHGFDKFVVASIQTFARHPYLTAPPVWPQNDGSIKYRLNKENKSFDVYVLDRRFAPGFDFKIIIDRSEGKREIANVTESGVIKNYWNEAGRIGSKINIRGVMDWAIPDKQDIVDFPALPFEITEFDGKGLKSINKPSTDKEITEYNGRHLEPIKQPDIMSSDEYMMVEVDRMSESGNPVAELEDGMYILDEGDPEKTYLVQPITNDKARTISRLKE